jgi:drug/metabolite transporter (DMT)-like permease
MSRRGWVLFLAMGLIWGVPYLLIKVAVDVLTPASLVLVRTAVAALILLPLALARGDLRPVLPRWRPLLAFAVAELAVPWFLLSNAERRLSSSLSGLLIAAVPLVGALLGWATGGERLGFRRILGLAIGIGGVAALVGLDLGGGDVPALLQMAVVAIGYAIGPFILARYLTDVPGLGVISAALTLTAIAYLPVGIAQMPSHWPSAKVIASVLTLSVLCTAIAFMVFFQLIDEVGPVRSTVITYVNPAVAVALGVVLLGEPLTIGIGVGFALVLVGSVLATRRSQPATTPATAEPLVAVAAQNQPLRPARSALRCSPRAVPASARPGESRSARPAHPWRTCPGSASG